MLKDIIFWDWNGTMLNDVSICVDSMNQILNSRKMSRINTKTYKELFNFPVRGYYELLGFDFSKDSFEDLSAEFISTYNSKIELVSLQPYVVDVLYYFQAIGKKQVVISAMEQKMLHESLVMFDINHYFDDVIGLSDIYANGKVELARNYILRNNIDTSQATFIGDTLHDAEVAEKTGCEIILVSNGHYSNKRLAVNGYTIIDDLGVLFSNKFHYPEFNSN